MAMYDAIQSAFRNAENIKRLGIGGSANHGHFSLNPLAADPTTTTHYEGRFWFRRGSGSLFFRGRTKASAFGTLRLPGTLQGANAAVDPASVAAGSGVNTTVNVANAELGDFCVPSLSVDATGLSFSCYVSAPGVCSVRFQNGSAAPIDLPSSVLSALVIKKV